MDFWRKNRVAIIIGSAILIMIVGVLFWNFISNRQAEDKNKKTNNFIDVSDVDNIDSVEAKLGEDMKITQGYLLNYTTKKSGVWYMSSGVVVDVDSDNKYSIIKVKSDNNNSLKLSIAKDKCKVKKNDKIYFVGTIDLETEEINLTKIDTEPINYNNVKEIDLDNLITNIESIKSNNFIVHGYLVTEGEKYKLFDTKDDYKEDNSFGNYFTITWKDKFPYTGTQEVSVKCKIADTYKLKECELVK